MTNDDAAARPRRARVGRTVALVAITLLAAGGLATANAAPAAAGNCLVQFVRDDPQAHVQQVNITNCYSNGAVELETWILTPRSPYPEWLGKATAGPATPDGWRNTTYWNVDGVTQLWMLVTLGSDFRFHAHVITDVALWSGQVQHFDNWLHQV